MRYKSYFKLNSLFVTVLTVSGCATVMRANVTTFHGQEHGGRGPISVRPVNEEQSTSLAFQSHSSQLIQKLAAVGYTAVQDSPSAQYVAFMTYGIDSGKTSTSVVPLYGQTGGGAITTTGRVTNNYGRSYNYSSTTTQMPTYGMVGAIPVTSTSYTRELNIDIYREGERPVKTYEIRAKSVGACGNINAVLPVMIEGVFKNFPYENGKSVVVEVDAKGIVC